METVVRRHFEHFHHLGLCLCQVLRPVFLLSSDDPGPWDPVVGEPSTCPGKGQDLAEPETLEAEATSVSILHKRAVRELKVCSISANAAILVAKV